MKKQSNNSMLQAICALIIMIGYFLPWVQASVFGESVFSFSFIEFIANTEKLSRGLTDYASVFSYNIRSYALLLYVIPLLTLIGAVIQWIGKYPIFAFYTTVLPVGIACGVLGTAVKNVGGDGLEMIGPGLFFVLLAGIVSIIEAWTFIGCHYSQYKGFIKGVTGWFIVSIIWWIVLGSIHTSDFSLFYSGEGGEGRMMLLYVFIAFNFVMSIGTMHFLFLIYVWIVVAISRANPSPQQNMEESVPLPQPVVRQAMEEALEDCPQCKEKISGSVHFCPHCGCDLKKVAEEKLKEVDNLRFAPPQYRGEN